MKFIPLILQPALAQAAHNGTKTMTRRTRGLDIINLNSDEYCLDRVEPYMIDPELAKRESDDLFISKGFNAQFEGYDNLVIKCPYGQPGDALWVREPIKCVGLKGTTGFHLEGQPPVGYKSISEITIEYVADGSRLTLPYPERLSLNVEIGKGIAYGCFKEACRTFLKIKSIRVERVQSISEDDILKEGVRIPLNQNDVIVFKAGQNSAAQFTLEESIKRIPESYQLLYCHWAELWCAINGRESWDLNPWCWAIEFEKIERPEEFLNEKL
jgi:hypothetical protein